MEDFLNIFLIASNIHNRVIDNFKAVGDWELGFGAPFVVEISIIGGVRSG